MNKKLLSGVKVIEIGQIAAGPFTGMLLADLGADVVKVEKPGVGDGMRQWPPILQTKEGTYSGNFASLNRNKRSITIDLKNPEQISQLKELCSNADVLLENYRPGVLKRLGMGYEDLKKLNPRLVYCSISGYGQKGPYSQKGAFDVTVQAISGLMSVTGEKDGEPVKSGVPVGDFVSGLYAAYSILAVLIKREKSGLGSFVDCSMVGSLLGVSALQTSEYFGTGKSPKKLGSAHPRNAPYQGFQAKDGKFVIAAGNNKLWESVCEIVGLPQLVDDERFKTQLQRAKNQKKLKDILQEVFKKQTIDEWLNVFDENGVPCAPVNTYHDILHDKHVEEMGLIGELALPNGLMEKYIGYPISISDFEFGVFRNPPELGEHNEEVFSEWLKEKELENKF